MALIATGSVLALAACSGPAASSGGAASGGEDEHVSLKLQEIYTPGDQYADAAQAMGDAVTEATDGSVEFEYFWGNSIVPSSEVAAAMRDGLVDIGRIQPPATPADFPTINWLSKATVLNANTAPGGLLQLMGAHLEFALNSEHGTPQIDSELDELGIRWLGSFGSVLQYDMLCSEPVTSLEDFEGLKVRVSGQAWIDEIENLGAEPVQVVAEEFYEAYQRGIVDCVTSNPRHWNDVGVTDLGGYFVPLALTGWNQDGIVISQQAWDGLTENQQTAMIEDGIRAWIEAYLGAHLDGYWEFLQTVGDGVELSEPDAEVTETIDEFQAGVIDTLAEEAPANVEDPQAIVDEYVALHDKWAGIVDELGFPVDGAGVWEFVDELEDPSVPPSEQLDFQPFIDRVMQEAYGR